MALAPTSDIPLFAFRTRARTRAVAPAQATTEPVRVSVASVNVMSVARTAAWLSVIVAVAMLVSGVLLWWAARQAGMLDGLEDAVASGLGLDGWTLPSGAVFAVWTATVLVTAMIAVFVAALLAYAFNRFGENVGGIEVMARVEERRQSAAS